MPSLRPWASIKAVARAALESVSLPVWQHLFPKDVIALCYHVVSDEDLPHVKYYSYKNRRQFEADVAYVAERQQPIGYEDVVGHRLRGASLPSNTFLFTFDDGSTECFNIIRPILQKYGVRGVFFAMTRQWAKNQPKTEVPPEACPQAAFDRWSPQMPACEPWT